MVFAKEQPARSEVQAVAGASATLSCEVAQAQTEVTWYKDGKKLSSSSKVRVEATGRGRRLVVQQAGKADAGEYSCEAEVMNKLCLEHRDKPIYLECSTHVSKNEMPTYQNLINFVRYFRCTYFNPLNIFFTNKDCKYNEIAMLKDISRYVGVKLGLLSFDYEYVPNANTIKIMLRFLNCGTAKIYHDNWKLKYHLIGGGVTITRESNFDLRNIKAAFEEDAPNWHDVADFNPTSQTTYDNNAETVDFGRAIVKGSDKLYISIEDTTGVYDPMYLCNSEDYIQRDANGRYCLFTFKA